MKLAPLIALLALAACGGEAEDVVTAAAEVSCPISYPLSAPLQAREYGRAMRLRGLSAEPMTVAYERGVRCSNGVDWCLDRKPPISERAAEYVSSCKVAITTYEQPNKWLCHEAVHHLEHMAGVTVLTHDHPAFDLCQRGAPRA